MQRVIGYAVAIVIGIAVVGYKFSQKGDQSQQVRDEVVAILEEAPDYETHGTLYLGWLDAHHEVVFDKHHMMGGRRSGQSFDGGAYLEEIFDAMVADATAAGYTDQAAEIQILRQTVYWEDE